LRIGKCGGGEIESGGSEVWASVVGAYEGVGLTAIVDYFPDIRIRVATVFVERKEKKRKGSRNVKIFLLKTRGASRETRVTCADSSHEPHFMRRFVPPTFAKSHL